VLNCDSSIDVDVNLGNDECTKTSSVKSCGIWILDHAFIAGCVIAKMATSILLQLIVADENLMAFANEVVIG
jgi:hypothetical protein